MILSTWASSSPRWGRDIEVSSRKPSSIRRSGARPSRRYSATRIRWRRPRRRPLYALARRIVLRMPSLAILSASRARATVLVGSAKKAILDAGGPEKEEWPLPCPRRGETDAAWIHRPGKDGRQHGPPHPSRLRPRMRGVRLLGGRDQGGRGPRGLLEHGARGSRLQAGEAAGGLDHGARRRPDHRHGE